MPKMLSFWMIEFLPSTWLFGKLENANWHKSSFLKIRGFFCWQKVQRPQEHHYYPGTYPDLDFEDFLRWDLLKEPEHGL